MTGPAARDVREPRAAPPAGERPRGPWTAVSWLAGIILAIVALFWLYLRQAATLPVTSDGSSNALQAWEMLHGNVLLHGWWLSDVSFYTTELPEYALVEAVRGLGADDIWISAAITYTLLVLLTGVVGASRGDAVPWRSRLASGLISAWIVLAPSAIMGGPMLVSSPDHTGTAVPLLLAFLPIDFIGRQPGPAPAAPRVRWLAVAAAGLLLAWTQVADQVAFYAGAVPVALICGLRAVAGWWRWHRAGLGGAGLGGAGQSSRERAARAWGYDLALAVAAVASAFLSTLALHVIKALGGFSEKAVPAGSGLLAPLSQLTFHVRMFWDAVLILFGANYFDQTSGLLRAIALVHLAGLTVAVAGLAVAGWLLTRGRLDRVSQMLLAGIVIIAAAGVFGPYLGNLNSSHEVAVILPFSAALAGRMLRLPAAGLAARGIPVRGGLAAAAGAGLAAYLAFLCYDGVIAPYPPTTSPLASWLVAHHLTDGLAGYWQANVTTLETGERVRVAPLALTGAAVRHWEAKAQWYNASEHYADFVISPRSKGDAPGQPAATYGTELFGTPARTYDVGGWIVQVWNQNLLLRVSGHTGGT